MTCMPNISVYNMEGKVTGELQLADDVFGVAPNPQLVARVATAQRANAAVPYAATKQRGQVRGGGKKPWRQKGTGSARHGSRRSPIWRGGGITFGPTSERNQSQKVNHKERQAALRMILSDKVKERWLVVIDEWSALTGKTKQLVTFCNAVATPDASMLFASAVKNSTLQRAGRNIPKSNTLLADSLNVADLLSYRYLVVDKAGVEKMTAHFIVKAKAKV